jgi:hypothetical protein
LEGWAAGWRARGWKGDCWTDEANCGEGTDAVGNRHSGTTMNSTVSRIRLLLRILGVICVLAVIPLIIPVRWLDAAHRWMGLGPFPAAPIAEYLARSVCALCTFYGGLLLVLARDVERFAPVIRYQALAIMLFSAFGIFAGVRAGVPAIWVIADAIGCWVFLLPIYLLSRKVECGNERSSGSSRVAGVPLS